MFLHGRNRNGRLRSELFLATTSRGFPRKFEVHEWAIMQDFSRSVESDRISEDLLRAIDGAGAFRNFKETLRRHRIESDWFAFRREALRQIALNWCEEKQPLCVPPWET